MGNMHTFVRSACRVNVKGRGPLCGAETSDEGGTLVHTGPKVPNTLPWPLKRGYRLLYLTIYYLACWPRSQG